MPLDPSYIGRTYPPTPPYEVGREKIREFAEAVGDANPAYTLAEAAGEFGHSEVPAPPTFPFAISYRAAAQVIEDPELGLDFSRVVHGDQRFSYTRPVRAGDRLSVTVLIEDIKEAGGNDLLSLRGDVYDAEGGHVVTTTMTLVARATEEV
ncbi:MaoC family dehydratase N-terminal domain-containing protein [Kitasatospora sp. SUK 42]|uniref:MaoC family dehydratase N-terminal domain-containing protein n=1 Tax=Kitasatospora sp. SUK 42 TaxID=1588882 RepID=UPI0018CB32DF|nr:MaoC family dehydratase N-terminal domain-containing protein [Kitasatospora sp. SUK 42]MBV2154801.1 MaoC family dehydratase N-terminal domain-containing protein [Kitasatospora sp. SUK 42]